MTAPRRFRWGQFSIRTLLLLMLCVACYFGGWAARQWQYEKELEAAAREAKAAAQAQVDANGFWPGIRGLPPVYGPGQPVQPAFGGFAFDRSGPQFGPPVPSTDDFWGLRARGFVVTDPFALPQPNPPVQTTGTFWWPEPPAEP